MFQPPTDLELILLPIVVAKNSHPLAVLNHSERPLNTLDLVTLQHLIANQPVNHD